MFKLRGYPQTILIGHRRGTRWWTRHATIGFGQASNIRLGDGRGSGSSNNNDRLGLSPARPKSASPISKSFADTV
jgi:hypothetical protein